jgi:hypothetical protein
MDKQTELMELCSNFIIDNKISCSESIYQCDCVSENSLAFIEKICCLIGYHNEKMSLEKYLEEWGWTNSRRIAEIYLREGESGGENGIVRYCRKMQDDLTQESITISWENELLELLRKWKGLKQ